MREVVRVRKESKKDERRKKAQLGGPGLMCQNFSEILVRWQTFELGTGQAPDLDGTSGDSADPSGAGIYTGDARLVLEVDYNTTGAR